MDVKGARRLAGGVLRQAIHDVRMGNGHAGDAAHFLWSPRGLSWVEALADDAEFDARSFVGELIERIGASK